MAIILKNAPKTEEGRKLNLSKEDEEKYRLVFRINRESKEIDLYGIWNPKIVYDNSYVIVPLTSTYNGCQKMDIGEEVRNVKDSTGDKNPYGRTQIFPWQVHTDDSINKGVNTYPYILQTL